MTFRDEASATLLSGSADGQLAVFDLSGGLDEDDAFQVAGLQTSLMHGCDSSLLSRPQIAWLPTSSLYWCSRV